MLRELRWVRSWSPRRSARRREIGRAEREKEREEGGERAKNEHLRLSNPLGFPRPISISLARHQNTLGPTTRRRPASANRISHSLAQISIKQAQAHLDDLRIHLPHAGEDISMKRIRHGEQAISFFPDGG